jgi:hypothetical protein
MEKWLVTCTAGGKKSYAIVTAGGRVIAKYISDSGMAKQIAQVPQLVDLRADWASIINRLAHLALDGCNSNDRDYAEDMLDMVRPFLEAE